MKKIEEKLSGLAHCDDFSFHGAQGDLNFGIIGKKIELHASPIWLSFDDDKI